MVKKYVIGLDIGTTCTKAVVIDEFGKIVGQGISGYSLIPVNNGGVEQNAQDWIDASGAAVRQAIASIDVTCVVGISCSTQGGSTVAVDGAGNFIGNAWTWMDKRSQSQAEEIRYKLGSDYIYRTTGSKIGPALDAAKLPNMKSDDTYKDAVSYLTTLEVVNRWLTGNPVIDPSNAAMRQLLNIDELTWDRRILQTIGVSQEELPNIVPAGSLIGYLTVTASEATGLPVGVPVFNGAHDQYCASIGAGAIHVGDMLLSAGTTWVLMGITDKPMYTDSYIVPGRHPINGLYGALASLVGSGASMQWFHNNFMPEDFDTMNQMVVSRNESTEDLFFFPYLNGAPYPIHNRNAKGVFAGISLEHDRFDFARAIMEGVAFGVRRAVEDFSKNGAIIDSISIMGGAAKSPVWIQMIASITGLPIKRLKCNDACAVGAAMIAACGANMYDSYSSAVESIVSVEQVYYPIKAEQDYYSNKFKNFGLLWSSLATFYKGDS